ncbi:MAG: PAC2 family protein [Desulfurococcaceae archaeon]
MIKFIPLTSFNKEELYDSYFITGFQGFGLVGYLSTRHIVKELGLKRIGFIKTRYMPEFTMYTRDRNIMYPYEVYAGSIDNSKVIVLLNHALPDRRDLTNYAEYLALYAKEHGVKELMLIGGLDQSLRDSQDEKYRWIPLGNTSIKLDSKILEERYIIGPLALTMMFAVAHGLKGVVILPFTEPYRPDPRASAIAVEIVGKIIGVNIETRALIEEAVLIEAISAEREKLIEEYEKRSRLSYIQ